MAKKTAETKPTIDLALLMMCNKTAASLCNLMGKYVTDFLQGCMKTVYPKQKFTFQVNEFGCDKYFFDIKGTVHYKNGDRIDFTAHLMGVPCIKLSHWHHKYGRDILTKDSSAELTIMPNLNEADVVKSIRFIEDHKNKH